MNNSSFSHSQVDTTNSRIACIQSLRMDSSSLCAYVRQLKSWRTFPQSCISYETKLHLLAQWSHPRNRGCTVLYRNKKNLPVYARDRTADGWGDCEQAPSGLFRLSSFRLFSCLWRLQMSALCRICRTSRDWAASSVAESRNICPVSWQSLVIFCHHPNFLVRESKSDT